MRRRDFTIGLLLTVAARSVPAQEPVKQHRIAIVIASGPVARLNDPTSTPGGHFGRSCAGWAMSKAKTSPSSGIPPREGPRTLPISITTSSIAIQM